MIHNRLFILFICDSYSFFNTDKFRQGHQWNLNVINVDIDWITHTFKHPIICHKFKFIVNQILYNCIYFIRIIYFRTCLKFLIDWKLWLPNCGRCPSSFKWTSLKLFIYWNRFVIHLWITTSNDFFFLLFFFCKVFLFQQFNKLLICLPALLHNF